MEDAGGNPPSPRGMKESKRGRESDGDREAEEKAADVLLEMVKDGGVLINFTALERGGDDVYNAELRRRTAGMDSEDELLRFMESLNGDWCSRKRMCVDAGEFGDVLPVGWKLVLALKRRRRDSHHLPYFLRYISPNGEQCLSCKEAACFLQTQFFSHSANQDVAVLREEDDDGVPYQNVDVVVREDHDNGVSSRGIVPYSSSQPSSAPWIWWEGTDDDNLVDVPIQNQFDCERCKMRFDDLTEYARHLKSVHRNIARRSKKRPRLSDGKYGRRKVLDKKIISHTAHENMVARTNTPPVEIGAANTGVAETDFGVQSAASMDRAEEDELANLRLLCEVSTRCMQ